MKVVELQENSFIVPIEKKEGESRLEYLTKSYECMKEFYRQNAEETFKDLNVAWCDKTLEILTGEQNFTSGFDFNVKWSIYAKENSRVPKGIFVRSHYGPEFIREVQELKKMWENFDYNLK